MNTTAHMAFGSHLNQFVGLERLLKDMEMSTSDYQLSTKYPPHNIIKYNDNEYVVELAVAGFSREELEITVEDCVLIMTGTKGEFDNRVFKSQIGEDMIGEVVDVTNIWYDIKNPANIVLQETESGVRVAIAPVMPFAKGNIKVYFHSIAIEADPAEALVTEYKRVFSPIVVPTSKIILK
jgi:hypothetical protein